MQTRHQLKATLFLMASAILACYNGQNDLPSFKSPIVGGKETSDWPAVGALVFDHFGFQEAFCTGTLIAPRWVLTAAHCISPTAGMPIQPWFVKFYIGSNANNPGSGILVPTDQFFPHPNYDPTMMTIGNDIGLIRLAKDVTSVPPMPINTRSLRGWHLFSQVTFVGFGASNGSTQAGAGVKRMTTMPMTWFDSKTYYTEPQGSGTCFGDSGGPGLLKFDASSTFYQIGVVSAGTESPTTSGDPCLSGFGIYTRVDAHVPWIAKVTGLSFPPCDGTTCACPKACKSDGFCDDTLCQELSCPEGVSCYSRCPPGDKKCEMECRLLVREGDVGTYDKVTYCIDEKCAPGQERLECAKSLCKTALSECEAKVTPNQDCTAYGECLKGCNGLDPLCTFSCEALATEEAKEAWRSLEACANESQCTSNDWFECVKAHCHNEASACGIATQLDEAAADNNQSQESPIEAATDASSPDVPDVLLNEGPFIADIGPDEGPHVPAEGPKAGNGCAAAPNGAAPWPLILPLLYLMKRRPPFTLRE